VHPIVQGLSEGTVLKETTRTLGRCEYAFAVDTSHARAQRRQSKIVGVEERFGLSLEWLCAPAKDHLTKWARQVLLTEDAPSATYDEAILNLCRTVESQLASTLGPIKELAFVIGGLPLGTLARSLRQTLTGTALPPIRTKLKDRVAVPGFVLHQLSPALQKLADLRSDTGIAHGSSQLSSASAADHDAALKIAIDILRGLRPAS
jgi:hypothetical protein